MVNEMIKAEQVRLITETGENIGVVSRREAQERAQSVGMDLVKIGEQDDLYVVKIMDFGKFLYLKKKQQNEAKKKQKVIQIKEIKMRPGIAEQDYLTKFRQAVEFLKEGKRVKFTLQFHGREIMMKNEHGQKFFDRLSKELEQQNLGALIAEDEQKGGPFWSKVYYIKGA